MKMRSAPLLHTYERSLNDSDAEAMTGDGGRVTLAMSLGLLTDPDGAPAGAVAVLHSATVDLIPFVSPAPSRSHQTR
jgi:hypothetical protein